MYAKLRTDDWNTSPKPRKDLSLVTFEGMMQSPDPIGFLWRFCNFLHLCRMQYLVDVDLEEEQFSYFNDMWDLNSKPSSVFGWSRCAQRDIEGLNYR